MKNLLAVLIVAVLATNASAADYWTNAAADNNFNNAANWTPTPTPGDDFYVTLDGANKAILAGNSAWGIDDLYVGRNTDDGELDITGGTHVLTNRFRIGFGGAAGTVNMSGAASVTAGASYATWGNTGSSGDINVTMSDSASVTVDRLTLGQDGSGVITVDMSGSSSLTLTLMDVSPASSSGVLRFGDTTGGVTVTVGGSAVLTAECAAMGWFDGDGLRVNDNSPGLLTINGGEFHLTGSTLNAWSLAHPDPDGDPALPDFAPILLLEDANGDDLGGRIAMEDGDFDLAGD